MVNLFDKPIWITENPVFLREILWKFSFERTDPGTRKIVLLEHLSINER